MDALAAARAWLAAQPTWLALALLVGASVAAAALLTVFGFATLRRATRHTRTDVDDVLLAELRLPVTATVGALGFYLAGTWLALAPGASGPLRAGALTVVAVAWGIALVRVGDRAIERVGPDSGLAGVAPIVENVLNVVVVAAVALVALSVWRVDVTPFLASAGIVGIAVGFAARDTIANFFGSLSLYVDGTYAVGDYVELDTGEAGTVVDISVRSTRLVTRDNVVITVPNALLNAARIVNRSEPRPHTRVAVPVGVAYGADPDVVEATLLAAVDRVESVVDAPEPRARLRSLGDFALEYELLCWVPTPLHAGRVVHALNREVYAGLRDAGVEIPYPRRDLTVRGAGRGASVGPDDGAGGTADGGRGTGGGSSTRERGSAEPAGDDRAA